MILQKIQIVNYKSCNNILLELEKDDPNILIGINDCGKSTILSAIGLLLDVTKFNFFQDDKAKKDLSNSPIGEDDFKKIFEVFDVPDLPYSEKNCYVLGEFELEEDDDLDSAGTHLQWAIDKTEITKIYLCRIFDNTNKTCVHHLLTPRGVDDSIEYYKEKATALGKVAKDKKIEKIENTNNAGRFSTLELLRGVMSTLDLQLTWCEYKFDKTVFPQFRYLDWNISLDQLTTFTKDTMQEQIKDELTQARLFANEQRMQAQQKINTKLDEFAVDFLKDIPNIEKLKAHIFFDVEPRVTDLMINKKNSDGDIHIESQGEGVKRQIWFSLIKWNALNAINAEHKNKKFIWCYDEPETHLYPSAQRDFYNTIKQTTKANVQTIISTHSTIFVDKTRIKSINKIDLAEGKTNVSKCQSVDDIFESLKLKNSDFLFYDKFIVVEGDTEEILIPHFFKLATGETLENYNIKIVNLGGKDKIGQNAIILEGILGDFKKIESSVYYILDNDARYKLTEAQIAKYNPTFVGKQDIEDSIATDLWLKIVNERLSGDLALNGEEINAIKDGIKTGAEEESNKKFYPVLISSIRKKLIALGRDDYYTVDDALPSKGTESGKVIIEFLNNADFLPANLTEKLIEIQASS